MLKAIFDWFRQPDPKAFAPAVQPEAAPYKVEAPTASKVLTAPAEVEVSAAKFTEELKSPSDLVAESLAPTTAPAPVAEVKKPAARKAAPKAAAKPAAKPAAMKAPAKKPAARKPAAKKPQ